MYGASELACRTLSCVVSPLEACTCFEVGAGANAGTPIIACG